MVGLVPACLLCPQPLAWALLTPPLLPAFALRVRDVQRVSPIAMPPMWRSNAAAAFPCLTPSSLLPLLLLSNQTSARARAIGFELLSLSQALPAVTAPSWQHAPPGWPWALLAELAMAYLEAALLQPKVRMQNKNMLGRHCM